MFFVAVMSFLVMCFITAVTIVVPVFFYVAFFLAAFLFRYTSLLGTPIFFAAKLVFATTFILAVKFFVVAAFFRTAQFFVVAAFFRTAQFFVVSPVAVITMAFVALFMPPGAVGIALLRIRGSITRVIRSSVVRAVVLPVAGIAVPVAASRFRLTVIVGGRRLVCIAWLRLRIWCRLFLGPDRRLSPGFFCWWSNSRCWRGCWNWFRLLPCWFGGPCWRQGWRLVW